MQKNNLNVLPKRLVIFVFSDILTAILFVYTVIDNITISDNVIIGAGAVACCNITTTGVYVGVPAKKSKK